MSAFPESGRSDDGIWSILRGRLRPEADPSGHGILGQLGTIARDDFVPPKLQYIPEGHETVLGLTHRIPFVWGRHNLPKRSHTTPDHQSMFAGISRSRLLLMARSSLPLRPRIDYPSPQGSSA